jgi:hypothetical protein
MGVGTVKLKQINLDNEEMPETVVVELTHDEAVYLALVLGSRNGIEAEEVMPGGAMLNHAVYSGLTAGMFNRFYEDGERGAAAAVRGQ